MQIIDDVTAVTLFILTESRHFGDARQTSTFVQFQTLAEPSLVDGNGLSIGSLMLQRLCRT